MILVTGGTGLVGSHLLLELVKTGEPIRAIHRSGSNPEIVKKVFSYSLPPEQATRLFRKIHWHQASLEDIPALAAAFAGVNKVYHCAALVSFDASDTSALRKTNIEGTANIVNLCISFSIEQLCYVSSIATMGLGIGEKCVTENFTWHPEKDHSEYAISKHGAEIEVWRAAQEGVPVIILNPGVIIGPGFWDKGSGQLFKRIDRGLKYYFPKTTGFVGAQDVAKAAVTAMASGKKNQQYIVVAENSSFKHVMQQVAEGLGTTPPGRELKPWMVYMAWLYQSIFRILGVKKVISRRDYKSLFEHTHYSNKKIINELSFEFTPIQKLIASTCSIYKKEQQS